MLDYGIVAGVRGTQHMTSFRDHDFCVQDTERIHSTVQEDSNNLLPDVARIIVLLD